jgi:hypothetical protein
MKRLSFRRISSLAAALLAASALIFSRVFDQPWSGSVRAAAITLMVIGGLFDILAWRGRPDTNPETSPLENALAWLAIGSAVGFCWLLIAPPEQLQRVAFWSAVATCGLIFVVASVLHRLRASSVS